VASGCWLDTREKVFAREFQRVARDHEIGSRNGQLGFCSIHRAVKNPLNGSEIKRYHL